ncbi:hypothetical protein RRG08_061566 [Elysia crispata]|uniref:Uncharacterized protein n=1 Tax=Elysia crispata TaxID=231223 RepID=A0AAE0YU38_9GAST|nr:hypothetical protein RRG08_061566 [Elysia crispata]
MAAQSFWLSSATQKPVQKDELNVRSRNNNLLSKILEPFLADKGRTSSDVIVSFRLSKILEPFLADKGRTSSDVIVSFRRSEESLIPDVVYH